MDLNYMKSFQSADGLTTINVTCINNEVGPSASIRQMRVQYKFKLNVDAPEIINERIIKHTHYHVWPDFNVPEGDDVEVLYDIAKDAKEFIKTTNLDHIDKRPVEKLLIHCRAGCGRTGTLLSLINSMLIADQSDQISVFSVVRRLRE